MHTSEVSTTLAVESVPIILALCTPPAHPLNDAKPRARRRRDSTASSASCSSLATLTSPAYQPVLITSMIQSGVNSPASTIVTIQSDTSPALTPPSGRTVQNGLVGSDHQEQSDSAWTSDVSAGLPLAAASLPLVGALASTPHNDRTPLPLAGPLGELNTTTQTGITALPQCHLTTATTSQSPATVPAPASTLPLLVGGGPGVGGSLSCSETSSECSDSNLDDMLAELLNSSPPTPETAGAGEKEGGAEATALRLPRLGTYASGNKYPDEVSISLVIQKPQSSAQGVEGEEQPAASGHLKPPCTSMPVLVEPAKGRRRRRSSVRGCKQDSQVGTSHDELRGRQDGSNESSVPELENDLQIEHATCLGGKPSVSFDGGEAVSDHSAAPPTTAASLPGATGACVSYEEEEGAKVCMTSQPSREDSSPVDLSDAMAQMECSPVDLSDAMAQMECGSESMPHVGSRGQLREAVDHTAPAPPPDPTPPRITVELSHTPDHVAAEADTASSEDSDSDMSLSEMEHSLSPLPLSPHANLQTLSPLPPSPQSRPRTDTISPLPPSPIYTHDWHVSTPISPLPPSPHDTTLSPLPRTPFHSPLEPQHKTETQIARGTPPSLPLLQFIASVPPGLHTPKPCCAPSPGISPSKPKAGGRHLRLSESSPFSPPPCASSRRGSTPVVFVAESGGQQTPGATAVGSPAAQGEPLEPTEEGEIVDSEDEAVGSLPEPQPREVTAEAASLRGGPQPGDGGSTGDKAGAGCLSGSCVADPVAGLEDGEEEGETTSPLPQPQPLPHSPLPAKERRRPSKKSSRRRRHKSLGSALDGGYMTSFDRLLQSVSNQPSSQSPSAPHSAARARQAPGSPPTMPPGGPLYGFPLPNPLEATPPDLLPGYPEYQLRSRKVELWEYFPHKRKRSGSGELRVSPSLFRGGVILTKCD